MADHSKPRSTAPHNDLTAQYVRDLFDYDPETGELNRRIYRPGRKGSNSTLAGNLSGTRRYSAISIDGRFYQAHRLIWLVVTGEWPKEHIDHIDGNGANNRWANLREATHSQNLCNTPLRKTNQSGYKGVIFFKPKQKWRASLQLKGKTHHLGYFETPQEASAAYQRAAVELHGQFARFD